VVCLVIGSLLKGDASASDFGEDVLGGGGPDERFGSSLWASRYSSMLAITSGTEWNTPRRNALSVGHRPITLPVSTSSAANNVVCRYACNRGSSSLPALGHRQRRLSAIQRLQRGLLVQTLPSAPAAIPAMIDVNLPARFTAADLTLVVLIATLPEINSDRSARSASAITGTKPANDTRFSSSNNGVARDHPCGSFTLSAFW
jgi:hypothetical protein